jgi:glyoxylate reductase
MRELFDAELNMDDRPRTKAELIEAVRTVDVLVPTVTDRIDAEVIDEAGPQMKLIASFSNGTDHIDVEAAARRGITVTNTPNVLTEDTADMTMALILAVPRRLAEGARVLTDNPGELGGNGRRPGCLAAAFTASASVSSAWAASAPPSPAAQRHSACRSIITTASGSIQRRKTSWRRPIGTASTRCLPASISSRYNCPSTPATYHLVSARRLALLQPTSYIVNTARGDVIDETALIKILREGKIAGAGLDVFENEPAVNPKLVKLANEGKVVILPHMSSATLEGRIDMGDKVIINIRTFIDGHRPPIACCRSGDRLSSTGRAA